MFCKFIFLSVSYSDALFNFVETAGIYRKKKVLYGGKSVVLY